MARRRLSLKPLCEAVERVKHYEPIGGGCAWYDGDFSFWRVDVRSDGLAYTYCCHGGNPDEYYGELTPDEAASR